MAASFAVMSNQATGFPMTSPFPVVVFCYEPPVPGVRVTALPGMVIRQSTPGAFFCSGACSAGRIEGFQEVAGPGCASGGIGAADAS
ncbi:hypothetical protein Ppa06_39290 [Planomonospora parontospora subsp. parontospora]|uniref:Uncharacterized protein n=2 Tax=Planomonospora parontospora TaxID=58119 RepID=A0AA37BI99_9ACTN|nr:hypothetical protein GCM10010126_39620 [Planomonospora parontospora]GII10131.1 hypothetical protein Ppa06_39290 [Planomonospora parontospora subsp. parontospora]